MLFFGMMLGYLFYTFAADKLGRKRLLIVADTIVIAGLLLFFAASDVVFFCFLRLFMGFAFSIGMTASYMILAEIVPSKVRGRTMVCGELIFIGGILYMAILVNIFFDNYEEGDWRTVMILNSILGLVAVLLIFFLVDESPRFLFAKLKYD